MSRTAHPPAREQLPVHKINELCALILKCGYSAPTRALINPLLDLVSRQRHVCTSLWAICVDYISDSVFGNKHVISHYGHIVCLYCSSLAGSSTLSRISSLKTPTGFFSSWSCYRTFRITFRLLYRILLGFLSQSPPPLPSPPLPPARTMEYSERRFAAQSPEHSQVPTAEVDW